MLQSMIHRGLGIIASNRIRVNVEHLRMQNILVVRQGTIGRTLFLSNQGSTHRARPKFARHVRVIRVIEIPVILLFAVLEIFWSWFGSAPEF